MAIFSEPQASSNTYNLFRDEIKDDIATPGQHVAKCIDVRDVYGVQQRKFQSEEMETVDLTAFLFEYKDEDGNRNLIASKPVKISGHEKSALYAFLKSWGGKAPAYGFDTATLKGKYALITVEHEPSKKTPGKVYPKITSIVPVPKAMMGFLNQSEEQETQPQKPAAKVAGSPMLKKAASVEVDPDSVPF
jgi:hypothetical protein